MSIADTPGTMTPEELMAMPDDGVERWLIRGHLRENPAFKLNRRNPDHGASLMNLAGILRTWILKQPVPRGKLYGGDTAFKLRPERKTLVGIDIAYISAELRERTPKGKKVIEGAPILAVEILSPSDTHEQISEKVQEYLAVGVQAVWVVDPDFETVVVYRPDAEPEFFNRRQELVAEPYLPGFSVRVSELFE